MQTITHYRIRMAFLAALAGSWAATHAMRHEWYDLTLVTLFVFIFGKDAVSPSDKTQARLAETPELFRGAGILGDIAVAVVCIWGITETAFQMAP